MTSLQFFLERVPSPIGKLYLVTDETETVRSLEWDGFETRMERLHRLHYGRDRVKLEARASASSARLALEAYFAGQFSALTALRVATGGTEFQRKIWAALRTLPPGTTTTYGELAAKIGNPTAVRAAGAANGANPIGIIVPCHRVIGANGSLTGFAGGIESKRWLLQHENAQASFGLA